MKPSLQLKLSQHLTLTPQLQQSIRLLQLSTIELHQEVERFLQENPMLEKADGEEEAAAPGTTFRRETDAVATPEVPSTLAPDYAKENSPEAGEYYGSDGSTSYSEGWSDGGSPGRSGYGEEDEPYAPQAPAVTTLRDHLTWQLSLTPMSERDRHIAVLLIDALDDDGYLTVSLEELGAMLPPELGIEPEELQIGLHHLHNLEPAGIGARTPAECLALQLKGLPEDTPYRALALQVVEQHLQLLAVRDFTKLKRLLHCDDDVLREVQHLIQSLNPRPGAEFAMTEARYIVPDVLVRKVKGVWLASLNEAAMPKLRLNRIYADILARHRDSSNSLLTSQLQEAKWLIRNVQQRFETILRVTQAIVDRQRHFFEHGEVAMRPLVLREIADLLGLHESTISRVTSQKYMLTPRGIFELKYFFGSHVATDTGGACSATAIRALIKQFVASEDPRRPLTDSRIAELLGSQGIVVARRTIAKYREGLQIPPVNLRKSL
jgi:RNA polymerase sigma-54 factor